MLRPFFVQGGGVILSADAAEPEREEFAATPWAGWKRGLAYFVLGLVALALLYVVWVLYLSGEPLFAVVVLALCVGIVTIFGSARFYTARFIFPAIAAVLVFIALPVLYTSYVGFTNYGARNLLTFERVTNQFLGKISVDKSTERPFILVRNGALYQLFFPQGEGGLLSEAVALDGIPRSVQMQETSSPPQTAMEMREVIKLRNELGVLSAVLPDGSELNMSGLRNFAKQQKVYELQPDG
ncbi:MAG TPA: hypothetical protein ENJ90_02870, partial [Devosia sp.]|nr:hypothetical protein [Devosia sp.]